MEQGLVWRMARGCWHLLRPHGASCVRFSRKHVLSGCDDRKHILKRFSTGTVVFFQKPDIPNSGIWQNLSDESAPTDVPPCTTAL